MSYNQSFLETPGYKERREDRKRERRERGERESGYNCVTFELFARPAILKMMSKSFKTRDNVHAILNSDIINTDNREVYARVRLSNQNNKTYATITGNQGSGILQSMSLADGLVKCPANKKILRKGTKVQVIKL